MSSTPDDRSPRLTWSEDGAPRSGRFGDVYFSREDGLAESRAVFLAGCGLPDAWAGRRGFTVGELGFGTGLNIVALLHLWRRRRAPGARLHLFSTEAFPLSRDDAARALAAFPEVSDEAEVLLARWPRGTPGFHRIELDGCDAVLDLAVGEAADSLARWDGRADAWFLDGFAPSTNPAMWSPEMMRLIADRSAPGARVATFTVAGAVRRGLAEAGFTVEKRPGHGRKRERLEARMGGEARGMSAGRVVIVGAGVAGAALARAFAALGVETTVVSDPAASMASGYPAALVTPRLDAGDAAIAALGAQALHRAADLYDATPGAVVEGGVLQLAAQARDAARFARVAEQPIWDKGEMVLLDAEAASSRLGEPVDGPALWMTGARAVRPRVVTTAWLAATKRVEGRVERVERGPDAWRVLDADGGVLAEGHVVVLAAGWGNAALLGETAPLSPVQGQADWVDGPRPAVPVAWGGYATPTGDGMLFGATHERGRTDGAADAAASARNANALETRLPALGRAQSAVAEDARGRAAAVRATTPDRLPLAGAIGERLFVLGGLGSRGFAFAPLLAEHVAALATGAPSPLPMNFARRLDARRH